MARARILWELIEPDFLAGILPVLEIARRYEEQTGQAISHTAINKHFEQLGLRRNLLPQIRRQAEAKALIAEDAAKKTRPTDAKVIKDNAEALAGVLVTHRQSIGRARKVCTDLLAELEGQVENPELLQQLGEILASGDEERISKAYKQVISLPGRVGTLEKLANALKNLVSAERESYGLNEVPAPPAPKADEKPAVSDEMRDYLRKLTEKFPHQPKLHAVK